MVNIRDVARTLGYMVSSFPAITFGAAHYRCLEQDKVKALQISQGNFDKMMTLSDSAIQDSDWWLQNLAHSYGIIGKTPFVHTIYSDASLQGCGAAMTNITTGGKWSYKESQVHITTLELLAAFYAVRSFKDTISNKNICLMLDNSTAVCISNKKGTTDSSNCTSIAVQILEFCQTHNILLTAFHIPGVQNGSADRESRIFANPDAEWMLNPKCLKQALSILHYEPELDFFAISLNAQSANYCSLRLDPYASSIDAFSISWFDLKVYCFPPFSRILQVLQKIQSD